MLIVVERQENAAQGEDRVTKRVNEIVLALGVRCVDSTAQSRLRSSDILRRLRDLHLTRPAAQLWLSVEGCISQ